MVGRLNGALSLLLLTNAAARPDTFNAAVLAAPLCQAAFTSCQLGADETNFTSCSPSHESCSAIFLVSGENQAEHGLVRPVLPRLVITGYEDLGSVCGHPSIHLELHLRPAITRVIGGTELSPAVISGRVIGHHLIRVLGRSIPSRPNYVRPEESHVSRL